MLVLVRVYRLLLSPVYHALFGPCCRFEPTCSAYAEQALKQVAARAHDLERIGRDVQVMRQLDDRLAVDLRREGHG